MKRTLRLRDGEYEILGEALARPQDIQAQVHRVVSPARAASLFGSSASDPLVARSLRLALAEHLGATRLDHRTDHDVLNEVIRLLATGRLALRPVQPRTAPAALPLEDSQVEPEEAAPPPAAPTEELTWIEIVLVDEDDQPIAKEKCELKAPDGSRLGPFMTDFEGRLRIDGIEPGQYEVRFIELDEEAWEAA